MRAPEFIVALVALIVAIIALLYMVETTRSERDCLFHYETSVMLRDLGSQITENRIRQSEQKRPNTPADRERYFLSRMDAATVWLREFVHNPIAFDEQDITAVDQYYDALKSAHKNANSDPGAFSTAHSEYWDGVEQVVISRIRSTSSSFRETCL